MAAILQSRQTQSGPDGELALVFDFASKIGEHAIRIAGVPTLYERLGAEEIDRPAMANAITLAQWYLGEALRLQAAALADPKLLAAGELLGWLQGRDEAECNVHTIQQ